MPVYHVNSFSLKVVFRTKEDFIYAINRLALCADRTSTAILAYCFMSTHFHLIVRTHYIRDFIITYKRALTKHLNTKQGRSGAMFNISHRELLTLNEMVIGLNYVLKNPIHHGICHTPFSYPYSSVGCYFKEELYPTASKKRTEAFCTPQKLDSITRKGIFGSFTIEPHQKIASFEIIDPQFFVSNTDTCNLYGSPKNFLYQLNKPLSEEVEKFGSDFEKYAKYESTISLGEKLLDWDVCQFIDSAISPKKVGELTDEDRSNLQVKLSKLGISRYQFKRCAE